MEYLFIYLLQAVETINIIAACMFIFSSILFLLFVVNYIMAKYENNTNKINSFHKPLTKCFGIFLILSILMFFIPTKRTLLLMGGTYLGKKAVNVVVTDEKIKKVDTIINLQLDKYIKELQQNEGK